MRRLLVSRLFIGLTLIAAAVLLTATLTRAAADPERQCQQGRYNAAAKYAQCDLKATAKYAAGGSYYDKFMPGLIKCRAKYTATWAKLQVKASGTSSTCDAPRFIVSGGTVTDNLTALQWEQKTDDSSVHDIDNSYTWTVNMGATAANGTVFTNFIPTLNSACFAGQCDWRLPSRAELQTILLEFPCSSPCIDESVFGPTASAYYWTSLTDSTPPPDDLYAWVVHFKYSEPGDLADAVNAQLKHAGAYTRAVRGGL